MTQLLRDFIFYPDDSKKSEAIVCRYPQFFAAGKMLDNIKRHLRPAGDGKGGTYFGATRMRQDLHDAVSFPHDRPT